MHTLRHTVTTRHQSINQSMSKLRRIERRAAAEGDDGDDVETVLDPRVRGLLRGETIRVRGLKMRVETKLWKLCILMTMFIIVWWARARQAANANAWADGGMGGHGHGESLVQKFNRGRRGGVGTG